MAGTIGKPMADLVFGAVPQRPNLVHCLLKASAVGWPSEASWRNPVSWRTLLQLQTRRFYSTGRLLDDLRAYSVSLVCRSNKATKGKHMDNPPSSEVCFLLHVDGL